MKILFLGPNPKNSGGIETFGRNLKKVFKEDLEFLTLYKNKNPLWDVSDVHEIFQRNVMTRLTYRFFKRYIYNNYINKKINPDIIIYNTPQYLRYNKFKGKKVLVQHQTIDRMLESNYYFNRDLQLIEYAKKNIDIWVALSPANREELIKKLNLDPLKVIVIRHTSEIPIKTKKKNINKNLIIISRLENKLKRLDLAIKAMVKLPEYTLNIYGDGRDEGMLKDLIKELSLTNVIFHGRTNQVSEKLDGNSIFIMTSDSEGYGMTNIEAMRRGLPIVLRNKYTAASDIIDKNGILLGSEWNEEDYIEAIRTIYGNYGEYNKESIKQGKKYDFEVIEDQWKKLMESLMENRRKNEF